MATLAELKEQFANVELRNKVTAATVIAAQALLEGTPSAEEKAFAKNVFQNTGTMGSIVTMSILATNADATIDQINNATDTVIQNQVNAVIPHLVGV